MVYCGKASQGCQSCRTRRIKCDKVRPQCTQCVRVRKPCPGYRDQLSLMFRDESTKVMQRAHAQWGVAESSELGEPSASSSRSASPASTRSRTSISEGSTSRPTSAVKNRRASDGKQLASEICATPADKAIHFYIEHFVIGLPDEPKVSHELRDSKWVHSRETRDIMAAIGLAGLANLTGDKEMNTLSKHHYGLALSHMAGAIRNPGSFDVELILRATVMMAMYEVTRGRDEPVSPARTHIMGGAAILTSILPLRQGPTDGPRGLLQLCFSMLASIQGSFQYSSPEPNILIPAIPEPQCADALPETFSSWLSVSDKTVSTQDAPSADLIKIIARFVQLSSLVRSQPLLDNTPQPASIIREALAIDKALDDWQALQTGDWAITEERFNNTTPLPPDDAVFEASYHVYSNMYIARVWNHYRWARTLVNQLLLESLTKFPLTTRILLPPNQHSLSLTLLAHLARSTLISTPTHYRHPHLQPSHCVYFDKTKGGAGIGIAGIPTLLFEVKVAACVPGIPHGYRRWALGLLETVWRDTGMFQARRLAGFLRGFVEREAEGV